MRVDMHAHLEPRMLAVDALLERMDGAQVDRVALIPTMNDPLPKTPERLLGVMRRLMRRGAGRALAELIHRSLLTPEGDLKLNGEVFQIYARPDNQAVADVVARHPERLMGWIFLNPRNNPGVLDDLERWRQVPGIIGVKLHPHWHDYRVELLGPVLRRAEELGLPVLIHLGFRARGDYRAIAEAYPELRLIAAHAGMPFFDDLWRAARSLKNLHVDLSSPYLDERLVRDCVAAIGPERCMYGTDGPYGFHAPDGSYDYGEIAGWVERLPVTSKQRDGIFYDHFAALLR